MRRDAQGLPIAAGSDEAAAAFDDAIAGYLSFRADLPDRVAWMLAADPEFGLAYCLKSFRGAIR